MSLKAMKEKDGLLFFFKTQEFSAKRNSGEGESHFQTLHLYTFAYRAKAWSRHEGRAHIATRSSIINNTRVLLSLLRLFHFTAGVFHMITRCSLCGHIVAHLSSGSKEETLR